MLSAREIIANPAVAVDCRDKYLLLADLGADASELTMASSVPTPNLVVFSKGSETMVPIGFAIPWPDQGLRI